MKDSGERTVFPSGMMRESADAKPRFDLLVLSCLTYAEQPLTRLAVLLARGAQKYAERNFELASSEEERQRAVASACRHFHQWVSGEVDEDHASALVFNVWEAEMIKRKREREAQP